ncbi:MAG: peptidoglycan recognition protein family protein [Actinomycetota bacterium]
MTLLLAFTFCFFAFVSPAPASYRIPQTDARDVALSKRAVHDLSKVIALPFRANMIGFTWRGSDANVLVSTRTPNGAWSSWESLGAGDNGADPGSREAARSAAIKSTEAHWVGLTDAVAVRMHSSGLISDVKLSAINTSGNSHPQSTWIQVFHKIGAWLTGYPQPAQAWVGNPGIRTRAQWGADESIRECCPRYSLTVEDAIVHHTDNPNNYKQSDVPAIIRSIYYYHVKSRGYADIAYNFLIDRFGGIWEGRAGGIDKPVFGAHALGMNHDTTGIALIGTFVSDTPPPAMMNALVKLLAWKMDVHHIPPSGLVKMTSAGSHKLNAGQQVWLNRVSGHRDVESTDCPGNRLYGMLGPVRVKAMSYGGPKIWVNMLPRLLDPNDGTHTSIDLKFWNSSNLHWAVDLLRSDGSVIRSYKGAGKAAEINWDGTDPSTGTLVSSGLGSIVINAWDDSNNHARTASIPLYMVTTHLPGTILGVGSQRSVIDSQGATQSIDSNAVFDSWYQSDQIVASNSNELNRYPTGSPLSFRNGTLAKTSDGTYWWIDAGLKRSFASSAVFTALGYSDSAAISVSDSDLSSLTQGPQIVDTTVHPDGTVVVDTQGTSWVIANSEREKVPSLAVRRSWYRDAEVVNATAGDLTLPQGSDLNFEDGFLGHMNGSIYVVSGGKSYRFRNSTIFTDLGYNPNAVVNVTEDDLSVAPLAGTI